MATVGHFTTLIGIIFFFFMLFDSAYERRVATYSTLGVPRFYKRVQYYIFKIRYFQTSTKSMNRIPGIFNSIF